MNETEKSKNISDLQQHAAVIDAKFEMFMRGMDDFKNEMRQQNEMRTAEMREMRLRHEAEIQKITDRIEATNKRTDTMFAAMDSKMDIISKHVQSLVTAATAGIGAVAVGIAAIIVAVVLK